MAATHFNLRYLKLRTIKKHLGHSFVILFLWTSKLFFSPIAMSWCIFIILFLNKFSSSLAKFYFLLCFFFSFFQSKIHYLLFKHGCFVGFVLVNHSCFTTLVLPHPMKGAALHILLHLDDQDWKRNRKQIWSKHLVHMRLSQPW